MIYWDTYNFWKHPERSEFDELNIQIKIWIPVFGLFISPKDKTMGAHLFGLGFQFDW